MTVDPRPATVSGPPPATAPQTATWHRGLARIGLTLCYLACFTIPWTAVRTGPLRLGDVFLLLALGALVAADLDQRMPSLPPWVWLFIGSVVLVGVLHEFFPLPQSFFLNRVTVDGIVVKRGLVDVSGSNLSVLIRFLIAIVGLPLIFNRAHHFDPRALYRSAFAFAAGAAVSALIAFTDGHGLTAIAVQITGIPGDGNRSSGLTENPNYVALGCVFGLPFAIWQLISPSVRNRWWAFAGLVSLLLGFYGSGSRAGAGAGVAGAVVVLLLLRRYRPALPAIGLVLAIVATLIFVSQPSIGHAVLRALRLTNDQGAGSDMARSIINAQGRRDFWRSPIDGVGFQVAGEAHIVYLQALAAGGLILLTGYLLFLVSSLVRCLRALPTNEFAAPLLASVLSGAIFNAAQNALTLRVVYVPAMLAAIVPVVPLIPRVRDRLTAGRFSRGT